MHTRKLEMNKRDLCIWLIACVTVIMFVILGNGIAPFLIDNDNIYLKTVASGEMTGEPEPHMYYMGFLSGAFLTALYRITGNGIPWFGLFLCVSMGMPLLLMLGRMLKTCEKLWTGIAIWLIDILVFFTFFYHYFAKTQYTIATGFVGAAALFELALLSVKDETVKTKCWYLVHTLPFLLLSCWAFGMREKGFLMLIPFFGMVLLGKFFDDLSRTSFLRVIILGALFGLMLLAVFGINRLPYQSDEWREFREYTDASEILFDFDGFPDYESHREIYEQMGITRSSFVAMTQHYNILLDPAINRDNLVELARIAEAERKQSEPGLLKKLTEVFAVIFRRNLLDYVDRPINVLVFLLYAFVVLLGILEKKWSVIRDIVFLIIARMFDWIYLVWYGRYPFRVTQIIYMAELVVLISIILNRELWQWKRGEKERFPKITVHPVFMVLLLAVVLSGIRFGNPVMKGVRQQISGVRELSVCISELEQYLGEHQENFYYFDMSHLYYMEDTLAWGTSGYENYVYMGSWMPNSPWYQHKLKAHGITDISGALLEKDNVFILYQQVDFDTRDFLDDYFQEHYHGTKIKVVDTFDSSNGFHYEVLKAVRE